MGKTTNLDRLRSGRYAAAHFTIHTRNRHPPTSMTSHAQTLAEFRSQVSKLLQERDAEWEASRRLIEPGRFMAILKRLVEEAQRTELPPAVRDSIVVALRQGEAERIQDLPSSRLKELTGLPPSKAIRALCVWFDLVEQPASRWPKPSLDSQAVATFVRDHEIPFDLLLTADVASVLDLGAGDLSFASELADQYAGRIRQQGRTLALHCIDRLRPQSRLGGPLHPAQERLQTLRARPDLSFKFWGDQDMCALERLDATGQIAPRYTIVTCWAPATPTFAYEPTRLPAEVIHAELQRTKGLFRQIRYAGEPALEVQHEGRALLFPPWKFEVRGPLALLEVLSRRGHLCVLGAVDGQVFWELLSQLLEAAAYRPGDQPFTSENLPTIFGDVYRQLSALHIGDRIDLSLCGTLRQRIPPVLPNKPPYDSPYRFISVTIRRGATLPNTPASSTARRFHEMVEETPPWMITLVPER